MFFDLLGRITLPVISILDWGISIPDNNKVIVRVVPDQRYLYLELAKAEDIIKFDELNQEYDSYYDYCEQFLEPEQWELIRSIDEKHQVVLPEIMRELMDWTMQTNLFMLYMDHGVYIFEDFDCNE